MAMTSVRMSDDLMKKLEQVAGKLRRSKGWVINDALREYLEKEEQKARRLEETHQALSDLEEGRVVDGDQVMDWMESWGAKDEKDSPLK